MAVVRCEICGSPKGLKHNYNHPHVLDISGNGGVLCGAPACIRLGGIWLTDEEERQYHSGRRNFSLSKRSVRVQVR